MANEDEHKALPEGLLTEALKDARARARQIEEEVARLSAELDVAQREVELLQELLAVRRGDAENRNSGQSAYRTTGEPRTKRPSGRTHPAVAAAITELEKAGRPLHISELMKSLREDGVRIPGSGQQANLIAHLMRNSQIVRPSRGIYALASWGIEEKPTVKPAARRRVRGRSKASTRKAN